MTELLNELLTRYPQLRECSGDMERAAGMMLDTYQSGGKILLCGNGGSCADCEHIVGELMKGFLLKREIPQADREKIEKLYPDEAGYFSDHLQRGIPAISLPSQISVSSAFVNDVAADMVYAQLVYGYAVKGDLLVGISTSGNSGNVVNAVKVARCLGIKTLALTGKRESALSENSDCTIMVPETETYKVQELHLPVYHYLCAAVEKGVFHENAG